MASRHLIGDMQRSTKQILAIGGVIITLYLLRLRKMENDLNIPEFMMPPRCEAPGCLKRAIPKIGKCIECAFEENLPKLYDDLEEIVRTKK